MLTASTTSLGQIDPAKKGPLWAPAAIVGLWLAGIGALYWKRKREGAI